MNKNQLYPWFSKIVSLKNGEKKKDFHDRDNSYFE